MFYYYIDHSTMLKIYISIVGDYPIFTHILIVESKITPINNLNKSLMPIRNKNQTCNISVGSISYIYKVICMETNQRTNHKLQSANKWQQLYKIKANIIDLVCKDVNKSET